MPKSYNKQILLHYKRLPKRTTFFCVLQYQKKISHICRRIMYNGYMSKRLFIAIDFPQEVKAAINDCTDMLQKQAARGSFTIKDNLHLTLFFIGPTDRERDIAKVLDETVCRPFTIEINNKLDKFIHGRGDIYWLGIKQCPPLAALQADLTKRLGNIGFVDDGRPYRPHITLGRGIVAQQPQIKVPEITFEVTQIELMQSLSIDQRVLYKSIYSKNFMEVNSKK